MEASQTFDAVYVTMSPSATHQSSADIDFFDSHCHAWSRWPYPPAVPDERTRGALELLLHEMDVNGVESALVVCAAIEKNSDNVEYVSRALTAHRGRLRMVPDLDCVWSESYHAPGSAMRLQRLAERHSIVGFAHYTAEENDGFLRSDEADELFSLAEELKLIVSLGAFPSWHADLRELANRHPTVPVLCNALGGVQVADGLNSAQLAEVLASVDVPNIYLKVAGLHYLVEAGWDYPWTDVLIVFEQIVETYGASRLCWGSDFPASTRFCTYRQSLELLRSHCSFLSPGDLRKIYGENLRTLLSAEND
jgi:L-fuconolactonase